MAAIAAASTVAIHSGLHRRSSNEANYHHTDRTTPTHRALSHAPAPSVFPPSTPARLSSPTASATAAHADPRGRMGIALCHSLRSSRVTIWHNRFTSPSSKLTSRMETRFKSRSATAIWLDNKAEVVADISVDKAFSLWQDREKIPQWMPWITSVKVQKDKPELSRWTLRYEAFGQNIELSWLAKNLQPTPNQKIHWRSVDGLPNRGAVRFFPKGPSACKLEMTISYEVPQILLPFATALSPLVESIIKGDLERFVVYARKAEVKA